MQWLFVFEYKVAEKGIVNNYLDDYLLLAITLAKCNQLMLSFLQLCDQIRLPISMEKTEWATPLLVFLGILLNGVTLSLSLPLQKRLKAISLLEIFLDKKKATVRELQQLCGYLNFLCRAIIPGRTFTRRMYAKFSPMINNHPGSSKEAKIIKPHHHVWLDKEFKYDCMVWWEFLHDKDYLVVHRPMIDLSGDISAQDVGFYSDTSGKETCGFGCVMGDSWLGGIWEPNYIS